MFADTEKRGYGLVDLTPSKLTATLRVIDDVTRVDASVATLAQFSVAGGLSRVERV